MVPNGLSHLEPARRHPGAAPEPPQTLAPGGAERDRRPKLLSVSEITPRFVSPWQDLAPSPGLSPRPGAAMVLPYARNSGGAGGWLAPEEPRGRSNSIPPAQTPTAKHMLAYLPRPPTDTSRYGTFPQKVWLAPRLWGILGT